MSSHHPQQYTKSSQEDRKSLATNRTVQIVTNAEDTDRPEETSGTTTMGPTTTTTTILEKTDRRNNFALRLRADSTGSTRGAFAAAHSGPTATVAPPNHHHHRNSNREKVKDVRKKVKMAVAPRRGTMIDVPSRHPPHSLVARRATMSPVADRALASLEDFDNGSAITKVKNGAEPPPVGPRSSLGVCSSTTGPVARDGTGGPEGPRGRDLASHFGPRETGHWSNDNQQKTSFRDYGGTSLTHQQLDNTVYGKNNGEATLAEFRPSSSGEECRQPSVWNILPAPPLMHHQQQFDLASFVYRPPYQHPVSLANNTTSTESTQQRDVDRFSFMARQHSGGIEPLMATHTSSLGGIHNNAPTLQQTAMIDTNETGKIEYNQANYEVPDTTTRYDDDDFDKDAIDQSWNIEFSDNWSRCSVILQFFHPMRWLMADAKVDEDGELFLDGRDNWTFAAFVRHFLFNPVSPEFTSLQQFCWAVVIGIIMGFYTAGWKYLIESSVELLWKTIPELLLNLGVFTDVDGKFPIYHYMWICPSICGGVLCYLFAILPLKIPDQNDWITAVHRRGVIDYRTFLYLFFLSTGGMASGLNLGPELPLVLTAGMAGSWLGLVCKQSMLQARVLNLTAASAAVGGFFGFPMAGALFVLELPHRMGLQYFEALSPATISSIVAVLCNRLVIGNDVTGYFSYPFLTSSLPSGIFTYAIFYGLFGAGIGTVYCTGVKYFKGKIHNLFHTPNEAPKESVVGNDDDIHDNNMHETAAENIFLLPSGKKAEIKKHAQYSLRSFGCSTIPNQQVRAVVIGILAGLIVGSIGIFVPHVMFWGESQLQNLIDKGRTPLPVFGRGTEPTAGLTALGMCMIDPNNKESVRDGFGPGCSALISFAKIITTGVSLGTGIICGHFWGPLFVGCSASHFLTDSMRFLKRKIGFDFGLSSHPCVSILCIMGSAHVVTYRAHMSIMLILTLTISAFDPEDDVSGDYSVAGDYSAVFPLLVVSVFVALMVSRQTIFYPSQRSRGDIMAVPEVLCEPGMEGRPLVYGYDEIDDSNSSSGSVAIASLIDDVDSDESFEQSQNQRIYQPLKQVDIEKEFDRQQKETAILPPFGNLAANTEPSAKFSFAVNTSNPVDNKFDSVDVVQNTKLTSSRLDELLNRSSENEPVSTQRVLNYTQRTQHRRIQSAPVGPDESQSHVVDDIGKRLADRTEISPRHAKGVVSISRINLVRITSYGDLHDHQPSLLEQARSRAASSVVRQKRNPLSPAGRHSNKKSFDSNISTDGNVGALNNSGRHKRKPSRENNFSNVVSSSFVNSSGHSGWNNNVSPQYDNKSLPHTPGTSIPPSGRHSRKNSEDSLLFTSPGGTEINSGALTMDDFETSFAAQVKNMVEGISSPRAPEAFSRKSPWTNNNKV